MRFSPPLPARFQKKTPVIKPASNETRRGVANELGSGCLACLGGGEPLVPLHWRWAFLEDAERAPQPAVQVLHFAVFGILGFVVRDGEPQRDAAQFHLRIVGTYARKAQIRAGAPRLIALLVFRRAVQMGYFALGCGGEFAHRDGGELTASGQRKIRNRPLDLTELTVELDGTAQGDDSRNNSHDTPRS